MLENVRATWSRNETAPSKIRWKRGVTSFEGALGDVLLLLLARRWRVRRRGVKEVKMQGWAPLMG